MHPVCVINELETAKQSQNNDLCIYKVEIDLSLSRLAGNDTQTGSVCLHSSAEQALFEVSGEIEPVFHGQQCNMTVSKAKNTSPQLITSAGMWVGY